MATKAQKLASGTLLQQIGLSTRNLVRWYLPTAAGVYAFYWLYAPDGGDVFHGEKPRTLSEKWHDASVMRAAYMPREASPVPVPHNPFRTNRSAADFVLASSKARWPKEAAARDSAGHPRAPLTESKAEAAARAPLSPSEYTGAEPEKEARVEAVAAPAGTRFANAHPPETQPEAKPAE